MKTHTNCVQGLHPPEDVFVDRLCYSGAMKALSFYLLLKIWLTNVAHKSPVVKEKTGGLRGPTYPKIHCTLPKIFCFQSNLTDEAAAAVRGLIFKCKY